MPPVVWDTSNRRLLAVDCRRTRGTLPGALAPGGGGRGGGAWSKMTEKHCLQVEHSSERLATDGSWQFIAGRRRVTP